MNIRCFVAAAAVTAPGSSGRHSGRETIGGVLKLDFNSYILVWAGWGGSGGTSLWPAMFYNFSSHWTTLTFHFVTHTRPTTRGVRHPSSLDHFGTPFGHPFLTIWVSWDHFGLPFGDQYTLHNQGCQTPLLIGPLWTSIW